MRDDALPLAPADQVGERLAALADRVAARFGDAVQVTRTGQFPLVSVRPAREGACEVSWIELGGEVILQVSDGGRWELLRTTEDQELLERMIEAVVAGRVVEVLAPARSSVTVTLADGSTQSSAVRQGLMGCLPLPGWPRWGRTVHYLPYAHQ